MSVSKTGPKKISNNQPSQKKQNIKSHIRSHNDERKPDQVLRVTITSKTVCNNKQTEKQYVKPVS